MKREKMKKSTLAMTGAIIILGTTVAIQNVKLQKANNIIEQTKNKIVKIQKQQKNVIENKDVRIEYIKGKFDYQITVDAKNGTNLLTGGEEYGNYKAQYMVGRRQDFARKVYDTFVKEGLETYNWDWKY